MNTKDFTYKDFDNLEEYKEAIGDLFDSEPLSLELVEQVMEHLRIYRNLKGLTV